VLLEIQDERAVDIAGTEELRRRDGATAQPVRIDFIGMAWIGLRDRAQGGAAMSELARLPASGESLTKSRTTPASLQRRRTAPALGGNRMTFT
jgi:hypothetical protein